MKAIKLTAFLLLTCVGTLDIFSQTNAVLSYLPEGAKMIIKINLSSLGQKISWKDLRKNEMFSDLMKDFPETGKEFFDNPGNSGIDFAQGLFLEIPQDNDKEKLDPVFYAIPRDTAVIIAMVKKIFPGKKPVKIPGGKLIIDKHTALAWNNEIVMLTGDDAKKKTINQKISPTGESIRIKQLSDRCKRLLSKRGPALRNREDLTSLIKEEGDLLLWINNTAQSQPKKNDKVPAALGVLKNGVMRKGDYTSGVVKFEDGKVVLQLKQHIPASLDSVYKKYPSKHINTDLLKKLPAGHPILICSFRFPPEMIKESLVKSGADKFIDSTSKQTVKIEDMLLAIKGDVLLALMKVDEVSDADSIGKAMNGLELFVSGGIDDKQKFKNLAALLQNNKSDSEKNGSPKKPRPLIFSNDSLFVVSLSQVAGQKFLESGGNNEEIDKIFEPYKNNPSAFFMDLRTVFAFALQPALKNKPEEVAKQASEVLGMFDKLVSYGGQYENNFVLSTVEVGMTNKGENSVKQFMNLLHVFYLIGNKKFTNNQGLPGEQKKK